MHFRWVRGGGGGLVRNLHMVDTSLLYVRTVMSIVKDLDDVNLILNTSLRPAENS